MSINKFIIFNFYEVTLNKLNGRYNYSDIIDLTFEEIYLYIVTSKFNLSDNINNDLN